MREEDQVVRPLADELCVLDGAGAGAEHPERLIANFPAVAVGAVEEVFAPALPESGDRREFVCRSGRDQQPSRLQRAAVGEGDREAGLDRDDLTRDELDAVGCGLLATRRQEIGGRHPVAGEEAVHVGRRRVARSAAVDDGDAPSGRGRGRGRRSARPRRLQRQPRHSVSFSMDRDAAGGASRPPLSLLFPGTLQ